MCFQLKLVSEQWSETRMGSKLNKMSYPVSKVPKKVNLLQSHRRALETTRFPRQTVPIRGKVAEVLILPHPSSLDASPTCASQAGSGNLNSRSALAEGQPLDKQMQLSAARTESAPEALVHKHRKGSAGMREGSRRHGQPHLCWKSPAPSPGPLWATEQPSVLSVP